MKVSSSALSGLPAPGRPRREALDKLQVGAEMLQVEDAQVVGFGVPDGALIGIGPWVDKKGYHVVVVVSGDALIGKKRSSPSNQAIQSLSGIKGLLILDCRFSRLNCCNLQSKL